MNDAGQDAAVIGFADVSFSYNGAPVLDHVTFTIRAREIVSIVGPNGGGKTTLLKLMLGLIKPASGRVRVFGGSPCHGRRRIGYMPQHTHYDPKFPVNVLDVVLMGRVERHLIGPYTKSDREAALEALAEVELESLAVRPFADLSGGQRQRVLIARALASHPELLLLDEPTSNIDMVAESKFVDMLQTLNQRMTILMVSHDLGFVSHIVERIVCVNRRVVVHHASNVTGDVIQEIYGGAVHMIRHDHGHDIDTGHTR